MSGPASLPALASDLREDGQLLLEAASLTDLHRHLLLVPGRRRGTCIDAELLFRAHCGAEAAAPARLETALLLLTDVRWSRLTARLLDGLVRTGLLTDEQLDELACEVVTAPVSQHRLEGAFSGGIVIVLEGDPVEEPEPEPTDDDDVVVVERSITPPLRRWAAARATRRRLVPVAELIDGADGLAAGDAAQVMRGVLDECTAETLPAGVLGDLVERGLDWPAGSVRSAALDRLVERGQLERAARLAAADVDEQVRRTFAKRHGEPDEPTLF